MNARSNDKTIKILFLILFSVFNLLDMWIDFRVQS